MLVLLQGYLIVDLEGLLSQLHYFFIYVVLTRKLHCPARSICVAVTNKQKHDTQKNIITLIQMNVM